MRRVPRLPIDFLREIVPADVTALVGRVIVSVLVGFVHVNQQACQVQRVRRRADLVVNDADGIVRFANVQHRLDEVFPIQAEHPRNADDEVFLQRPADCQFTLQFRLTVDIQRLIILAIRLPRRSPLPVEHIICADVSHLAI